MARRGDADLWILLIVLLLGLGGLTAASSAYRGVRAARITLGFLGGIYLAWSRGYQASSYGGTWYGANHQAAAKGIASIAGMVGTVTDEALHVYLEQWLLTFDPLGIVRDAIEGGTIEDSFLLKPVPP